MTIDLQAMFDENMAMATDHGSKLEHAPHSRQVEVAALWTLDEIAAQISLIADRRKAAHQEAVNVAHYR